MKEKEDQNKALASKLSSVENKLDELTKQMFSKNDLYRNEHPEAFKEKTEQPK